MNKDPLFTAKTGYGRLATRPEMEKKGRTLDERIS
jgi:hypothetical protein